MSVFRSSSTAIIAAVTLRSVITVIALAGTFGFASAASANSVDSDGPLTFDNYLLQLPGRVVLTYYEDIDRDGWVDILAVHAGEETRDPPRNLVVFFQTPSGFVPQPDVHYRVPDDITLIDLGDVDEQNPGQELLMMHGEGIDWVAIPRPDTDRPQMLKGVRRPLVEMTPLFARANPEQLGKRDVALSVDESDLATLFIPYTYGYRVYYPDDGYTQPSDIKAEHMPRVLGDWYSIIAAEIQLCDMDGDGAEDLVTSHRDQIRIHHQRDGRFPEAADSEIGLDLLTDVDFKTTRERDYSEGVDRLISVDANDFDADGLGDLFLVKRVVQKKAVINDKQQYQLFLNHQGRFSLIPDQAFVLKSFDEPEVLDLDGDGRLDMITGYFEFSIGNLIKALLSKKFSIDLSFFLYEEGGFPDSPNETRDIKIRFSLSDMDENFTPAVEIEGDFDGDGRVDFLLQTEDEKVEVFLGTMGEGRLFEKKSSVRMKKVPASENAHVEDFNGDGLADVAFDQFPDRKPYNEGWINVVLSRRTGGRATPGGTPAASTGGTGTR